MKQNHNQEARSFDAFEAERLVAYCIKMLLMTVETIDDIIVINKIASGVPVIVKKANEKQFDKISDLSAAYFKI